jgi:phage shock protein A
VIGRPITGVKRLLLRLQLYVFDDLARQADEAIQGVERRLEVEIATRERLERQVGELEARIRRLEEPQRRAR